MSVKSITIHTLQKLCYPSVWVIGLLSGTYFAIHSQSVNATWMLPLARGQVSVIGLLCTLIFPFVLSAILFRLSMPALITPIIFLKAFSFAWCANAIILCYADAGWLLRYIFLFSDSCVVILLLWFWLRNHKGERVTLHRDLLLCIVFALLIGCIDCNVIVPFGASLFA